MIKPSSITHWLQHPGSFSEADRKAIAALLKSYPYFVPARYMEAVEIPRSQSIQVSTLTNMQLYMGNWVQFHEFMGADETRQPMKTGNEIEEEYIYKGERLGESSMEEIEMESIDVLDDNDDEFNAFDSWEDEEDYTVEQDETEHLAAPEPAPAKPSKPLFTKKQQAKAPEPPSKPARDSPPEPPPAMQDPVAPFRPAKKTDPLIQPIYSEEYFLHQGIQVSDYTPADSAGKPKDPDADKSLMVVMSFGEWLNHFKTKGEKEKEEVEDQKALKTMWQKEKLAAALEEENEEIPEAVFEMAVNSITKEDDLASESLAEIMVKQGKYDKAIDMYRKLSLRNPQKSAYFARKIDRIIKENES